MKRLLASQQYQNKRLDFFLAKELNLSRNKVKNLFLNNQVSLNSKNIKASTNIKINDLIEIKEKNINETQVNKSDKQEKPNRLYKKIQIIFENSEFLIINKPAGLITHPIKDLEEISLANYLLKKYPKISKLGENRLRPGIVHRLDKETSGLIIIPLTNKSYIYFKELFKQRNITKTYRTICYGDIKENYLKIDKPIKRSSKNISKFSVYSKRSPRDSIDSTAKSALTILKKLKSISDYSYLEIDLKTGRTHQIRVHLKYLNHPVVGDRIYKYKKKFKDINISHQLLHAYQIKFKHDNKKYSFKAPLPFYFQNFLKNNNLNT